MTQLLLLFLAGGFGTLARHGLDTLVGSVITHDYPYGTSIVNAVGCLLFGIVFGLANHEGWVRDHAPILMVGFLGAFTTFSAFANDAAMLMRSEHWVSFGLYVGLQNLVGITFVVLGLRMVR